MSDELMEAVIKRLPVLPEMPPGYAENDAKEAAEREKVLASRKAIAEGKQVGKEYEPVFRWRRTQAESAYAEAVRGWIRRKAVLWHASRKLRATRTREGRVHMSPDQLVERVIADEKEAKDRRAREAVTAREAEMRAQKEREQTAKDLLAKYTAVAMEQQRRLPPPSTAADEEEQSVVAALYWALSASGAPPLHPMFADVGFKESRLDRYGLSLGVCEYTNGTFARCYGKVLPIENQPERIAKLARRGVARFVIMQHGGEFVALVQFASFRAWAMPGSTRWLVAFKRAFAVTHKSEVEKLYSARVKARDEKEAQESKAERERKLFLWSKQSEIQKRLELPAPGDAAKAAREFRHGTKRQTPWRSESAPKRLKLAC
jgi:hypothetical protein